MYRSLGVCQIKGKYIEDIINFAEVQRILICNRQVFIQRAIVTNQVFPSHIRIVRLRSQ
jgi:hypothetical protein